MPYVFTEVQSAKVNMQPKLNTEAIDGLTVVILYIL